MLTADPPVAYTEISARLGIPVGNIGPTRRRIDKIRRHPAIAALVSAEAQTTRNEIPVIGAVTATSQQPRQYLRQMIPNGEYNALTGSLANSATVRRFSDPIPTTMMEGRTVTGKDRESLSGYSESVIDMRADNLLISACERGSLPHECRSGRS